MRAKLQPTAGNSISSPTLVGWQRPLALLAVTALAFSACTASSTPSPSAASSTPSATSAAPSAVPSVDPLAPYPSKSGSLPSLKLAQSVPSLSNVADLVAKGMNFFEYQGVKLEFITLQSDATALQAVTSGTIDIDSDASTTIAGAVAQGLDFQAIANRNMMTLQVCVRKDWAQQHNITSSSPLGDKIASLKGATIAISGPGAISDRAFRYLLTTYGKLNPDSDTKIVQVGGFSAMPGALDANQVQAFLLSPPSCGGTKNGLVLVQPSEIAEFKNAPLGILFAPRKWIESHKDIAGAAATAIAMGSNFILKHPDAALKLIQKDFAAVDPQVLADAFNGTIKPSIVPDGKFDASMWQSINKLLLGSGTITKPLETAEGTIWTNAYIGDASVK